jgi:hypothetical protein
LAQGVVEFHGGFPTWLLRRATLVGGAAAINFGHTVLARTQDDLDTTVSFSGSEEKSLGNVSRGDRTPIELFLAGAAEWQTNLEAGVGA